MCLERESKDEPRSAGSPFFDRDANNADRGMQAIKVEARSPTLSPQQPLVCDW